MVNQFMHDKKNLLLKFIIILFAATIISSCVKRTNYKGYYFGEDFETNTKPGTNVAEIMEKMGSPTTSSTFGKPVFFYVNSKYEQKMFFIPKLVEQRILAIHFSDSGNVEKVKRYTLKDAKDIDFSSDSIEIQGNEMGVLEQILGNIGRFSNQGRRPGM